MRMIIIVIAFSDLIPRFCTKLRRFAECLPICAVGAWVYAVAFRAFAREFLLVHEGIL
jgi:hypothetical protein